jgi:hypothetical protein
MNKHIITLLLVLIAKTTFASSILIEGFEYANHDMEIPIGWVCDDNTWLCGYLEKDHNRIPHTGDWYAFSNADDSWMFMQLYLLNSMQYRINCWAISDGSCQLELWAGTSPAAADMHTLLFSTTVGSDNYEKISAYAETIPEDCEYIGIRALTNGNATYLTIDDIDIEMVEQYDFIAEPITRDSAMYPGSQGTFSFWVQNIGYDAVDITAHPSNEFFTDFSCQFNGTTGMTFPTQPGEKVMVTLTATLRPDIEPGTVCWLDVNMTIPCNCNTAMVTFWVTPLTLDQTAENTIPTISVYPNPASDYVIVEGEGLTRITILDLTGKAVMTVPVETGQTRVDVSGLISGHYFIVGESNDGRIQRSLLKR